MLMQASHAIQTGCKISIDGNYEGASGRLLALNEPNLMTAFGVLKQEVFAVFARGTLDNGR